ncbi:unnamed protein product [Somion occarium]|uniref:Uncharacterized protein n=1 Tax=Somion occarium TaxID=3059160 RepID=A0ABP1E0U4_9APHY
MIVTTSMRDCADTSSGVSLKRMGGVSTIPLPPRRGVSGTYTGGGGNNGGGVAGTSSIGNGLRKGCNGGKSSSFDDQGDIRAEAGFTGRLDPSSSSYSCVYTA